jgi:magnesium-transporting ATPase (P-type)
VQGDGINDVAAIQSADVAAALLNGFGSEDDTTNIDFDDERRRKSLQSARMGSNRMKQTGKPIKNQESQERIRKQIATARKEIDDRVALRQRDEPTSGPAQYTFEDLIDIMKASWMAVADEMDRARRLKKGGGGAARILAEERKKAASTTGLDENGEEAKSSATDETAIKPGEVSLVAPFSCLHPSVDGVDAILRQGIATAASVLATQQVIALHSLMSCYYLTTLYRDGFRYGSNMWHVEVLFDSLTSDARFKSAFSARPRLPPSVLARPPRSLFDPAALFSTLSQAIIHVVCMGVSVRFAAGLERDTLSEPPTRDRIGLRTIGPQYGGKFHQARTVLSQHSRVETEAGKFSLLGRPPFRPNYETNVVFMFNILQTAITALMDHKGKPFYRSILECRDLCLASAAALLFFVVCVSGTIVPDVTTKFLQLRPFPTTQSKLVVLGIAVVNIVSCGLCRWIVDHQFVKNCYGSESQGTNTPTHGTSMDAADYEEQLLQEEASINLKNIRIFVVVLCLLLVDIAMQR